ncbi:MAG: ECF transporter S component [Erysipelotrichaceae bacterium]|nr:ECF transporter S component [Erysipelotrichaceae bacterium]MBR3168713.1 ECF transporter S component [Erysipelotrichaceae bacterium]
MKTKNLVLTALFIALGIVLPIAFHVVPNGGVLFSPMHIPVLVCGLVTGPIEGLICGIVTPALSSALTGMPPAPRLPGMMVELAVYGLVGGLMMRLLKDNKNFGKIYLALIVTMLCGRIAGGLVNALILNAGNYTLKMWLTGYFLNGLPGIIAHLILVPLIVRALQKAKLSVN